MVTHLLNIAEQYTDTMVMMRPLLTVLICVGFFLFLQAFIPKAMALRNPSSVDRFLTEGHRTHKRKNFVVQRARDDEVMGSVENTVANEVEPYDFDRNPEELSAFMVDYANMIRNDVILLDKSVETRTRKRGNIKVEKYNQVISDPTCSCKPYNNFVDLGEDVFPRKIEIRNCSQSYSCTRPFKCEENLYNLTILKKRERVLRTPEDIEIHQNLKTNWYATQLKISVGCSCLPDYVTEI